MVHRQTPTCPCECSLSDPKTTNVCAGAFPGCKIVRCLPRSLGFGCCDDDIEAIGIIENLQQVAPVLALLINDDVGNAVRLAPDLAEANIDVLEQCIADLDDLNFGIIPEEFEREPLGTSPVRIPATLRQNGMPIFDQPGEPFRKLNEASLRILLYIVTGLRLHLA